MALAGTRQLRSQGPVSVNAHRTERVTVSEGQEEAHVAGGRIGAGGGGGDCIGVGVAGMWARNGGGHADGAGTRTGLKANEQM